MTTEYLATFFTHSGAIKYKRFLEKHGYLVSLLPVPRRVSSNCGIAARFKCNINIKTIISEDIEQLYTVTESGYDLLYKTSEE